MFRLHPVPSAQEAQPFVCEQLRPVAVFAFEGIHRAEEQFKIVRVVVPPPFQQQLIGVLHEPALA